jgi:hypothetical protein
VRHGHVRAPSPPDGRLGYRRDVDLDLDRLVDRMTLDSQSVSSVRVFTADEVAIIVAWFGGDADRFQMHVDADDHEVLNVGMTCAWDDDQGHNSMRRIVGPWVEKP